ncbi:MAG: EAL domain-containing protein [Rhodospirillaceae bacterium]|nr:EAL domain-containing protein [Rhodospirillaceae bacterium]
MASPRTLPIFLLLIIGTVFGSIAPSWGKTARILILNSYHKGYNGTDEQSETILDRLEKAIPTATKDVVYMDWKRHPTQATLDDMETTLRHRYAGKSVDLLITTDDAALIFALQHRRALFSDAPIVYSGIFPDTAKALTANQSNVTGVYEYLAPKETFDLARKLNPNYQKIYVIHDSSETSLDFEIELREAIAEMTPPLEFHVIRDMPFKKIQQRLATLPEESFVLLASYARDSDGLVMDPERFAAKFSQSSSVPVFTLYNHIIGSGVVGGVVLDGELQGEAATQLAISILHGSPASSLPPVDRRTLRAIIDYDQAQRFSLPLNRLGPDVRIHGKPFSFIETYWKLVLLVTGTFIVLLSLVFLLLFNIRQRRHTQKALQKNYANLEKSQFDLQRSEERYRLVAQASRDIIWDWNIHNDQRSLSGRVREVLGYDCNVFADIEHWYSLIHPRDLVGVRASLSDYLEGRTGEYRKEYRIRHAEGNYIWLQANGRALFDGTGRPYHMIGSYTDITAAKEHQQRIDFLAFHDSLTGLPNREQLRSVVDQTIARIKPDDGRLTLIFIDMDNFKSINDSSGHKVGDMVLVQAAQRLQNVVSSNTLVSRLGGDEFVLVVENLSESDAPLLQSKLLDSFRPPFDVHEQRFYISCSAGSAVYPDDGLCFDELLQNADIAMYQAKKSGKGALTQFSPEMKQLAVERVLLHSRLRDAQSNKTFSLHFQPQVDAVNGHLRGAEALLRWNDAEMGAVSPDLFIPACEESGLIIPIGRWVLQESCRKIKQLQGCRTDDFIISVNVSVVQLMQSGFEKDVLEILRRENVNPNQIELEITESQLMGVFEAGILRLRTLMNAGVKIALDDFGTGYSSLTYLRRLPLNILKLDKEFIRNLHQDQDGQRLTASIIHIAHDMGLQVVAEGVEQMEQRTILANAGCDWLQGYMISRPLDERKFEDFLENWTGFPGA